MYFLSTVVLYHKENQSEATTPLLREKHSSSDLHARGPYWPLNHHNYNWQISSLRQTHLVCTTNILYHTKYLSESVDLSNFCAVIRHQEIDWGSWWLISFYSFHNGSAASKDHAQLGHSLRLELLHIHMYMNRHRNRHTHRHTENTQQR